MINLNSAQLYLLIKKDFLKKMKKIKPRITNNRRRDDSMRTSIVRAVKKTIQTALVKLNPKSLYKSRDKADYQESYEKAMNSFNKMLVELEIDGPQFGSLEEFTSLSYPKKKVEESASDLQRVKTLLKWRDATTISDLKILASANKCLKTLVALGISCIKSEGDLSVHREILETILKDL